MFVKRSHEKDLVRLITKKKWKSVNKVLQNDVSSSHDMHILNLALCYNPPLYTVQRIVKNSFDTKFEKDEMDRYSLYYALIYGTTPDVILYLIQLNAKAVIFVDKEGMTPLHHFFQYIIKSDACLDDSYINEVVDILCYHGQETILKEDIHERNVIEYAIEAQVGMEIIKKLQSEVMKMKNLCLLEMKCSKD